MSNPEIRPLTPEETEASQPLTQDQFYIAYLEARYGLPEGVLANECALAITQWFQNEVSGAAPSKTVVQVL